ncbi:hypothetical protein JGU66_31025 [Myxococcaceae bacterium JPH2]|nr:hypothetical protein [Myxococcaceae bacterium JPH2]
MSPLIPFFVLSPIVAGGTCWWVLNRIGTKRDQRARAALDGMVSGLRGHKPTGTVDLQVREVSWSGDTELSPHHCRVRVVMGGVDARSIPPRFVVESAPGAPRPPPAVLSALRTLDAEVMASLTRGGWRWQRPNIDFEPESPPLDA